MVRGLRTYLEVDMSSFGYWDARVIDSLEAQIARIAVSLGLSERAGEEEILQAIRKLQGKPRETQ